jgi:hypothetical protein
MKRCVLLSIVVMIATLAVVPATPGQSLPPTAGQAGGYELDQLLGFPFPWELVAAPTGQCFAWSTLQRGTRVIWVAAGPDFQPRSVVTYGDDDGQELSNLVFSGNGRRVLYVRGGDHGSNWTGEGGLEPNPSSSPVQQKMQLWSVSVDGGLPTLLADGDEPVRSGRQRLPHLVARRKNTGLRVHARQFQLHRDLRGPRSAHSLRRPLDVARQRPALVAGWCTDRLRAAARPRGSGPASLGAIRVAVGHLGR